MLTAACSSGTSRPPVVPTSPASEPPSASGDSGDIQGERGRASYYSDRLAGRSTASGEPYRPGLLTAAHRKLPFGTVVDVIRADGRRVRVTINDRGPFTKGRIIDLSRKAAEAIGMIREGVVDVTVVVVSKPPSRR
ncbi:septal ring lytic transglycosylase RlpA family protein [Chondromyces crocatus]